MYDPPKFLTVDVLAKVLAEFTWPDAYTLHADFDGIEVRLPRCRLYVTEGFESDMDIAFLPESTGIDELIPIGTAIRTMEADPNRTLPPEPKTQALLSPQASLEKVKNELRTLLTSLFTYLSPSLSGDFDWISSYLKHACTIRPNS